MDKQTFSKLGWVVAAALIGILSASGFVQGNEKIAVVDITKVVESSEFGINSKKTFDAMKQTREDLLQFIDTYQVLTPEQATSIKDLSLKETPTPEDKASLERVKQDVIASHKKQAELMLKTQYTPEERTLIEDYGRRAENMKNTGQQWLKEFTNSLQNWADKQKMLSLDKARAALSTVAKAGGYSLVLETGIAPYGANDVTDATLKAMNAAK